MVIVQHLNPTLPAGFIAEPWVRLGSFFEVDVGTFESEEPEPPPQVSSANGEPTTMVAPPSLTVETDLSMQDEYEVRVFETSRGRELVAAIEIVSPANKDRPEHRQAFVAKCLALLRQGISVSIIDVVTIRDFNFYRELLSQISRADPAFESQVISLYAVTCRLWPNGRTSHLKTWTYPLALGLPLPRLPLWLSDELLVWLNLEETYTYTCRALKIL
jgi:hypothetical protein